MIHLIDVFRLFDLTTSEVLRLRLVSRKINSTLCSRNFFWKLSFPIWAQAPTEAKLRAEGAFGPAPDQSYYEFVVHLKLERALQKSKNMISDIKKARGFALKYRELAVHEDKICRDLNTWKQKRGKQLAQITGMGVRQIGKSDLIAFQNSSWQFPKPRVGKQTRSYRIRQTARRSRERELHYYREIPELWTTKVK